MFLFIITGLVISVGLFLLQRVDKTNRTKRIMFSVIFIYSLFGIYFSNIETWLILSPLAQMLWVIITSSEILRLTNPKSIIVKFNKALIYIVIIDFLIMVLSASFGFRLLFMHLYQPIFYISLISLVISLIANYYIIIRSIMNRSDSFYKKIAIILSSFFYPIGVYMVNTVSNERY